MAHRIVAWLAFIVIVAFAKAGVLAADGDAEYDVIIRGGTVYEGSGEKPVVADLALQGDKIAKLGDLSQAKAKLEIDARGLAVAPGFINMLSWAGDSLLHDGRSQSDLRQGVTLEVLGEGWSMGPLNEAMRADMIKSQGDLKFDVPWTSLSEFLDYLEHKGTSTNVASFVGATTVRIHVLGYEDRRPTRAELKKMCDLVRTEMQAGALGVGSSLIYAPAFYADTHELTELCKAAAEYDGMYISHIRSEGNRLLESVDEFLEIARQAGVRAEIYHLKAAGEQNWPKLDQVIAKIEKARSEGLEITADIYPYTAGGTGLNAAMPPWVQEGGLDRWIERLRDPKIRARVIREMRTPTDKWENLMLAAGSPERVLLVGFKSEALKPLTGRSLAEVARQRGVSPEEAAINLVIEDGSRVDTIYFFMDEANVRKKIALPWVSFCSDAESLAPEGPFLKSHPHPRAYGSFARLLGKYVREEQIIPLETAVYRLTGLPAKNLRLADRGRLAVDYHADVVIFDPATISDRATYAEPHQYATGVKHVFVNGSQVLRDGEHTGAMPGRAVKSSGRRKSK
jgi:N-acyl-D-amino-acid deacylase